MQNALKELAQPAWHELSADQVAACLETDPATGLEQAEVEARLRQFGPNQVTARKRLSEWMRFLLQFHQPLIKALAELSGVCRCPNSALQSLVI